MFATQPVHPGETVLEIDDSRAVDEWHPLGHSDDRRHCDYLEGGKVVLMQPPERHINHSCDPNTFVRAVGGRRLVVARRAIAPGEEITYDYSINSSGDTVWDCSCGAPRCRRRVHSDFFHLPVELQREYLPLLDAWFRRERAADVARLERSLGVT